jgi:hypothetical protein
MASVDWPTLLVGAIPGCIALGAALVGYGKLMQEVRGLASRVKTVEVDVGKLSDLKSQMATIEERTHNTADNVKRMADDMSRITSYLLDEARSFNGNGIPPRRSRS